MSPSSENPTKPVERSKGKSSSKRQSTRAQAQATPPPPQDEPFVQEEDEAPVETPYHTYGTREIGSSPQNALPPESATYHTAAAQAPFMASPPSSSPRWTAPQPAPPTYHLRNGSLSQSPSSPVYSPRRYSLSQFAASQSPASSPPSYFTGHQSPSSRAARLHPDQYMQPTRFPYHPPPHPRSLNSPASGPPRPYFRSFDTLETSGNTTATATKNVVLSGYDGHLDVASVGRRSTTLIARLDVDFDVVLGAKIVPCTSRRDEFRGLRPLVALILHGRPSPSDTGEIFGTEQPITREGGLIPMDEIPGSAEPYYQTRVEVRSLRDASYVATLYKSPVTAASLSPPGFQPSNQAPICDLVIEAKNDFIVVASGASGEVFIFAPSENQNTPHEKFCCIGKFWTSVQKRSLSSNADSRPSTADEDSQFIKQVPIISLSQRWLAIAPPSSASRHSVQGIVPISPDGVRPPGVESVTAPTPPASNCSLDIPDPESFTNKVAKGVAKEVIRGAQWVGAQGWQAWQNYWNKSPQTGSETGVRTDTTQDPQFPPTHAEHQQPGSDEQDPAYQVSLIDLQHLLSANSTKSRRKYEPLATFAPPAGCSFISFAPNGVLLLTVSRNGDTQLVWDLLRLGTRRPAPKAANNTDQLQQSIRQVAKFSRFSNASVVDVAWSAPKSDALAMVTDKGTVHIFKLPSSAFVWPPPRRRGSLEEVPESKQSQSSTTASPNIEDTRLPMGRPGPLSSAASKVSSTARPIVATVRQRSNSSVSMLTNNLGDLNISTAAGLQKGKALAAGVSKSLGAAAGQINQMRRASESRFHLKRGHGAVQAGCVRFLTGAERGYIGALWHDTLVLHWAHRSAPASSPASKDAELALADASTPQQQQQPRSFFRPTAATAAGATDDSTGTASAELSSSVHPLASAEIDASAPFQPFYTDRRVALSTYKDPDPWDPDTPSAADALHVHGGDGAAPWAFGTLIATDAVDLGTEQELLDELSPDAADRPPVDDRMFADDETRALGAVEPVEEEEDEELRRAFPVQNAEGDVSEVLEMGDEEEDDFFAPIPEAGRGAA